ncbi:hypothetical protein [Helicobacter rodentium]|uniref:hypothetical protein n=1 Tax=Helicobacter rodentium TaxID=59617 RepID=UPI003C6D942F
MNTNINNEFNTQEIQDIISTQESRKETLKTNTNNLTAGESKLVKRLESYILTFDLKALRGENLPVGTKNIKGFLKNIFGEQAMYVFITNMANQICFSPFLNYSMVKSNKT